jgi:hypothetical protein
VDKKLFPSKIGSLEEQMVLKVCYYQIQSGGIIQIFGLYLMTMGKDTLL